MDGGEGTDTLSYAGSSQRTGDRNANDYISGVTVTLNGTASGPGTHAEFTDDQDNTTKDSASNFENLTGSSYNDMLTGDDGPNVIKGGSGRDRIDGGSDADTLEGGASGDWLTGDNVDFLSYESSGSVTVDLSTLADRTLSDSDKSAFGTTESTVSNAIKVSGSHAAGDIATSFKNVIGGRGGDTLTGDADANKLLGMGGNDTLTGNGGGDTLKGGDGNDTLKGGTGADILDGGPGADELDGGTAGDNENDTATYASATAGVTVDLSGGNLGQGDARGDSYTGIEKYLGSDHADTFISGKNADNITGGPDTGDSGDTVSYERSEKGVTVDLSSPGQSSDDAVNPTGSYARGDTLNDIENVIGSRYSDKLTAGSGSVINGGRGDDDLFGSDSSDTFVFAPGDGSDEIGDSQGNGTFTPGSGANHDRIDLSAFTGIASLDDLEGEITLLSGGQNTDIDLPNGGEITLYSVTPTQLVADNFIFHSKPVNGSGSSETLKGDHFNNTMDGKGGNDRLFGEQGRDTLNGGPGNDELYGGEDKDTFVFTPGNGNDYIMDFTRGTDKIDLTAFDTAAGVDYFSSAPGGAVGDNWVINLPEEVGGGTITVLGVATLTDSDFMF